MAKKTRKALDQIQQDEHFADALSKKVTDSVLACPRNLITADPSLAAVQVPSTDPTKTNSAKGQLLRIRSTNAAAVYIQFDDNSANLVAAPTAATVNALELFGAGVWLVTVTGNFMRCSAALARIEVLDL